MKRLVTEHGRFPLVYRIAEIYDETPAVRSFVLDGKINAAPGQFVMVWLPGLDEKPFSLSGVDPIMLTVNRVGRFTAALHELAVGSRVWLLGPLGNGFTRRAGELALICGGCGAAALLYLAETARRASQTVHAVLGARDAAALLFPHRFADLGCVVHVATDDGSRGYKGSAVELAAHLLRAGEISADALYGCGPEAMLDAVYHLAQERALPCQLSYEAYMRCGIGVCGSCSCGGKLICQDGPVFDQPPGSLAEVVVI